MTSTNLTNLINKVTEFVINPEGKSDNKILELKRLLVEIYAHYLTSNSSQLEDIENQKDDEIEPPNFDYKETRKIVESNFLDLGLYHSILNSHKIFEEVKLGAGDAIDDLTDIIKDLLEVKWRFENTNSEEAIWYFELFMRGHSEQHLVDLLKYLKDLEK